MREWLHQLGKVASYVILLVLALGWTVWVLSSPLRRYLDKFSSTVYFPSDTAEDRFQYFRNLTIRRGEKVGEATCVLCSVTVHTAVGRVTALWGDVTVAKGGSTSDIEVVGGRITAEPGSKLYGSQTSAVGGTVTIARGVHHYHFGIVDRPSYFYPGQRSWPVKGVPIFVVAVLLAALCGGNIGSAAFRQRVNTAVRRVGWSATLGIALTVSAPLLAYALGYALMFLAYWLGMGNSIFLLEYLFLFAVFFAYLFVVAVGFGALAESLGSLIAAKRVPARIAGATTLVFLMLVPVVGFFVVIAAHLISLGAGIGIPPYRLRRAR